MDSWPDCRRATRHSYALEWAETRPITPWVLRPPPFNPSGDQPREVLFFVNKLNLESS
jgi:hypothetical protein